MCPMKDALHADVEEAFNRLAEVLAQSIAALRDYDDENLKRLDKELELAMGLKERRVGALRQHILEHRC
jgi:hypothetical protein